MPGLASRNKDFDLKEDWGEQMSGQSKAVLVIVPTHGRSASDEDRQLITPDKVRNSLCTFIKRNIN